MQNMREPSTRLMEASPWNEDCLILHLLKMPGHHRLVIPRSLGRHPLAGEEAVNVSAGEHAAMVENNIVHLEGWISVAGTWD
jgi:hypothetical protein